MAQRRENYNWAAPNYNVQHQFGSNAAVEAWMSQLKKVWSHCKF